MTTQRADIELDRDAPSALFPLTLVCEADGSVAAIDGDAALLPEEAGRPVWLAGLLAGAGIDPARPPEAPVAVGTTSPAVDGVAARGDDGRLVLRLRPLSAVPGVREAERRLALYEAVLATGPVFVHVQDATMRSLWASSLLRDELGYRSHLPTDGEANRAFVHPDDRPLIEPSWRQAIEGTRTGPVHRRYRVRAADGEWRWLLSSAVNLLDEPAVGGVVVHALDITEEVHREQEVLEARRRLVTVIDALEEAVLVVAGDRVEFANAPVGALLPSLAPAGDLIGMAATDVVVRAARDMAHPDGFTLLVRDLVRSGERVDGLVLPTADGRSLEHHLLPVPAERDRPASRVWVVRDVTERAEQERDRRRVLDLEREARAEAERRSESLQQLDRLKTEFVANVSHELRTPLSALLSYLELVREDEGELSEEARRVLGSAARAGERLSRLVDDLLVIGRLESGSLEVRCEPVDVPALALEVVAEVRAGRPEAGPIAVEASAGPAIRSDRLRVAQILWNLLDNAVKYGPPGSAVALGARVEGGHWVVEVRDHGPGIDPADLRRAFEPFFRGRADARGGAPGSGLGLAICAQLAERLGGAVDLENAPGGGTTARLLLPLAAPGGEEAP